MAYQADIMPVVKEMQALRAQLALYAGQDTGNKLQIDSTALEDLLRRRMFVVPAFEVRECCSVWSLVLRARVLCVRTGVRLCVCAPQRRPRCCPPPPGAARHTHARSTTVPPACSTSAPLAAP